jgi:hydrogenase nickel incorporation protein HypA/HybF
MHELSIALSMIEQIEQVAARQPGTVRSAQVRIGVLSGVDCEALRFAWEVARTGTPLESTTLQIESVPLRVRCPACGSTHAAEIHSILCPRCVTPDQEILEGRELQLASLEIDE